MYLSNEKHDLFFFCIVLQTPLPPQVNAELEAVPQSEWFVSPTDELDGTLC